MKKFAKLFLVTLVVFTMAVALFACGGDKPNENNPENPGDNTDPGDTTPVTYDIKFDYNCDEIQDDYTVTVEEGKAATVPVRRYRSGYNLAGWFTEAGGGTEYNLGDIKADATVYAKWIEASDYSHFTFAYRSSNDGYNLTKIDGFDEGDDIVIPESYGELPVLATSNGTQSAPVLTQGVYGDLSIPDGITSIGNYAFYFSTFTNDTLNIPQSVTNIGNYAFSGFHTTASKCVSPFTDTKLVLNEGLVTLGQHAFSYNIFNNKTFELPSTLTKIDNQAFRGSATVHVFTDVALKFTGDLESIGNYAFQHSSFSDLQFNEGLKTIGETAFSYGTSISHLPKEGDDYYIPYVLEKVTFPASLETIGTKAFMWAPMKEIEFAENSHLTTIGIGAFAGHPGTSSTQPSPLTSSQDGVTDKIFQPFTTITFPASLKTIEVGAFIHTKLKEVKFEDGCELTDIKNYAFTGSVAYPSEIESVELPAISGTNYGSNAFANNSNLSKIVFKGTTGLGTSMFQNCTGLTGTLELPSTLKEIGSNAFAGCTEITEVKIPQLKGISFSNTFSGCTKLNKVTFAEGTVISNAAANKFTGVFQNCTNLTQIVNFDKIIVENINSNTFSGCSSLTSITLPDSVVSINGTAFINCNKLANIYIKNNSVISEFSNISATAHIGYVEPAKAQPDDVTPTVHVPDNLYGAYLNSMQWGRSGYAGNSGDYTLTYTTSDTTHKITLVSGMDIADREYRFNQGDYVTFAEYDYQAFGEGDEVYYFDGWYATRTGEEGAYQYSNPFDFMQPFGNADVTLYAKWILTQADSEDFRLNELYDLQLTSDGSKVDAINGKYYMINGIKDASKFVADGEGKLVLTLPAYYNGKPVIGLSDKTIRTAVFKNISITKLIIPETYIRIGNYVFYQCTSLEEVVIGTNVTALGSCAFEGCSSLTKVTFSKNVFTSIGSTDFKNCTSLNQVIGLDGCSFTGLVKGKNITSLFSGCTSLTSLALPAPSVGGVLPMVELGSSYSTMAVNLATLDLTKGKVLAAKGAFNNYTALSVIVAEGDLDWYLGQESYADALANGKIAFKVKHSDNSITDYTPSEPDPVEPDPSEPEEPEEPDPTEPTEPEEPKEPVMITVTYVYANGTDNGTAEIESGTAHGAITAPDSPEVGADGIVYVFGGWYLDEDFTELFDTTAELTEDVTLYAKWVKTQAIITYVYGNEDSETKAVNLNRAIEKLPEPVDGEGVNVFAGWYTDEDCQDEYDAETVITEGKTLYAKWVPASTDDNGEEEEVA